MSEYHLDRTLSLLAFCGIIGPIFYTIVLIILGLLRPGYSHVTQSMSELGEVGGPNAIMMNTIGFPLLGFLLIAFAIGLHRGLSEGEGSMLGPGLIVLSGVGLIGSGIFPCDPGCIDVTLVSKMHSIMATIAAFAMIFAALAIFYRVKNDLLWQNYQLYSLLTGIVTAIIASAYMVFEPWLGVFQRLSMGVSLLWIEIMAIQLLRLSHQSK
ncbi:MAG: DUF998 domain-containing protein [Candidatus Hodarchaeota archaeon]